MSRRIWSVGPQDTVQARSWFVQSYYSDGCGFFTERQSAEDFFDDIVGSLTDESIREMAQAFRVNVLCETPHELPTKVEVANGCHVVVDGLDGEGMFIRSLEVWGPDEDDDRETVQVARLRLDAEMVHRLVKALEG